MEVKKEELVAKIIKATKKKGTESLLDKLCEYPGEHLTELLKVIENLKK